MLAVIAIMLYVIQANKYKNKILTLFHMSFYLFLSVLRVGLTSTFRKAIDLNSIYIDILIKLMKYWVILNVAKLWLNKTFIVIKHSYFFEDYYFSLNNLGNKIFQKGVLKFNLFRFGTRCNGFSLTFSKVRKISLLYRSNHDLYHCPYLI